MDRHWICQNTKTAIRFAITIAALRRVGLALCALMLIATNASAFWRIGWTDNSTNETGFRVERKVGTAAYAQIGQVGAGILTFDDTTSVAGTQYCYRVLSYNTYGTATGAETCAVATAPAAPGAPTLIWIP